MEPIKVRFGFHSRLYTCMHWRFGRGKKVTIAAGNDHTLGHDNGLKDGDSLSMYFLFGGLQRQRTPTYCLAPSITLLCSNLFLWITRPLQQQSLVQSPQYRIRYDLSSAAPSRAPSMPRFYAYLQCYVLQNTPWH